MIAAVNSAILVNRELIFPIWFELEEFAQTDVKIKWVFTETEVDG